MSADRPAPKSNIVSEQLRPVYDVVAAEPVPPGLKFDDELDPGVGAEQPQRPRGGPKSNAAASRAE
jgi:hypothetical protein